MSVTVIPTPQVNVTVQQYALQQQIVAFIVAQLALITNVIGGSF